MEKHQIINILFEQYEETPHTTPALKFGKFKKVPLIICNPQENPVLKGFVQVNLMRPIVSAKLIIEVIGRIDTFDASKEPMSWIFLKKESLIEESLLSGKSNKYPFDQILAPVYHSVQGTHFKINYLVRATFYENSNEIEQIESDFRVIKPSTFGNIQNYFGEFGVPETLHVKVEFNKTAYYLDDILIGKVTINLTKVSLKSLEVQLIKQETAGTNHSFLEVVYQKEVKSGGLTKDEMIPIKINLETLCLEPTTMIKLTHAGESRGEFNITYYLKIIVFPKEGACFFRKFPFAFKQNA